MINEWRLFNGRSFLGESYTDANSAASVARSKALPLCWVIYFSPGRTLYAYTHELTPLFALRTDLTIEDLHGWDDEL